MKSKLLVSFLFFSLLSNVVAQEVDNYAADKLKPRREPFFKIGMKYGYDMHPLTFKPKEIMDQLHNGYQWGAFLQMGYSFYLQPEVYYAMYPAKESSISSEKVPTIRAPLLVGLRFLDLKILSLHIMGGPVFYAPLSELQEEFVMQKFTYHWQVGVGIHILGHVRADIRYQLLRGIDIKEQYNNLENSPLNVTVGIQL